MFASWNPPTRLLGGVELITLCMSLSHSSTPTPTPTHSRHHPVAVGVPTDSSITYWKFDQSPDLPSGSYPGLFEALMHRTHAVITPEVPRLPESAYAGLALGAGWGTPDPLKGLGCNLDMLHPQPRPHVKMKAPLALLISLFFVCPIWCDETLKIPTVPDCAVSADPSRSAQVLTASIARVF